MRKRSTTSVAVLPTGSKVAATGKRVSIEPMWWWSRISTMSASLDAGHALGLLAVVHQQQPARLRVDQLGARHQPDRHAVGVHDDRRAVVDLGDAVGDVAQQVVGLGGQRVAAHHLAAGTDCETSRPVT